MKSDTILVIGALAAGGYLIYKSDIASGLSEVAGGVGDAATGLGSGIGQIGYSAGDIAGSFASGVNSVLDFVNPLGALGNAAARNIEASGEISESKLRREGTQEEQIDRGAFDITQTPLTNIQAQRDVFSAEQRSLRSKDWEQTKTNVQDSATNVIEEWAKAGSTLSRYNPFGLISSWVQSRSTSKSTSLQTPVSPDGSATSNVSSSSASTSSSSSSGSLRTSKPSTFLEAVGYVGQSTESGIVYTKPTPTFSSIVASSRSIRAPVSTKKWYNPISWF